MIKYANNAFNRIQDGIRKYSRIVAQARQRGMNERDTGDIVKAMLGDMLGFDPFFDVTADVSVRGANADYAVLADASLQFLLLVKPVGTIPNAAHLLRLSGSSAPQYAQWAILTNGDLWFCYRLAVGVDRHAEQVFKVSLLENKPLDEKAGLFFLLSREGVSEDALFQYWEKQRILHPGRIASLLLSDEIINIIRREIQRTANYRVDRQTLCNILTRDVLRSDALAARDGEGANLPSLPQCFAYVHNPHEAQSWKLRFRNPDGTPNAEMLTLAVADLSGDIRGLGIPADDLPLVKQRLRLAYLELGITEPELPEPLRL